MRILFVQSQHRGSQLIRWGTGEDVSHIVLEFAAARYLHSYGSGIQPMGQEQWDSHGYRVMRSLTIPVTEGREAGFELAVTEKLKGLGYDWPALFFLGWRLMLRRFFGKPLPSRNYADQANLALCTEAAEVLCEVYQSMFGVAIMPAWVKDVAMLTPGQLYQALAPCFPAGCALPAQPQPTQS